MSRKKKTDVNPQITDAVTIKGNHLTVTKYPNGTADLVWDWDALLEEVRAATSGVNALVATTEAKVKKTRAKKVVDTVVETVKVVATKVKKAVKDVIEEKPKKTTRKKKGE